MKVAFLLAAVGLAAADTAAFQVEGNTKDCYWTTKWTTGKCAAATLADGKTKFCEKIRTRTGVATAAGKASVDAKDGKTTVARCTASEEHERCKGCDGVKESGDACAATFHGKAVKADGIGEAMGHNFCKKEFYPVANKDAKAGKKQYKCISCESYECSDWHQKAKCDGSRYVCCVDFYGLPTWAVVLIAVFGAILVGICFLCLCKLLCRGASSSWSSSSDE
jgi:hypothetical protein